MSVLNGKSNTHRLAVRSTRTADQDHLSIEIPNDSLRSCVTFDRSVAISGSVDDRQYFRGAQNFLAHLTTFVHVLVDCAT